jgi:hypothetical protein
MAWMHDIFDARRSYGYMYLRSLFLRHLQHAGNIYAMHLQFTSELFTSTSRLFINFLLFFLKRAIKVCLLYHTGVDFDFQQLNFPHSWIQLTIYHGFRALFPPHT